MINIDEKLLEQSIIEKDSNGKYKEMIQDDTEPEEKAKGE